MIFESHTSIEGIITLEVIKEDGTLREGAGLNVPFKNLITDAGLNGAAREYLGSLARYCRVGTGSVVPAFTDTALSAQLGTAYATTNFNSTYNLSVNPYTVSHTGVSTFALGAVVGNLTEIGCFSDSSGGTMWSRALIKDAGGNPTVLTILASEQLKVTYEIRIYVPTTISGSITLTTNGTPTTITYTGKPASIGNYTHLGASTALGSSGVSLVESTTLSVVTDYPGSLAYKFTWQAYTQGSFSLTAVGTIPIGSANFATGIGAMCFGSAYTSYGYQPTGAFQVSFSPKIVKLATQTLQITIKKTWGRYTG